MNRLSNKPVPGHAHSPGDDHDQAAACDSLNPARSDERCGACGPAAGAASVPSPVPGATEAGRSYRIATMDCAAEEAEIRRAVDGLSGLRGLRFNLGQRLLTIDADDSAVEPALAAIRKVGFDPQPVAPAVKALPAAPAHVPPADWFEAIAMPWLFDYPSTFAKQELADLPLWGHVSGVYGNIHVARDQGATALRQMMKAVRPVLAAGRPIAIFPEGTRVPHGTRPELQAGFAALYKLLGLPVVPVAVDSGPLYHRRWKQRGTITIHFGEPIPPGLPRAEIEARVHAAINCLNG